MALIPPWAASWHAVAWTVRSPCRCTSFGPLPLGAVSAFAGGHAKSEPASAGHDWAYWAKRRRRCGAATKPCGVFATTCHHASRALQGVNAEGAEDEPPNTA